MIQQLQSLMKLLRLSSDDETHRLDSPFPDAKELKMERDQASFEMKDKFAATLQPYADIANQMQADILAAQSEEFRKASRG